MSSDVLLARKKLDSEAVSGGTFTVAQTHLGFCPADLKLEIRRTEVVLLDDEHMVMCYPFADLVMWSQNNAQVTIMLMKNLRRLVFTARSRWHAKRIVLKMHEVTDSLANSIESSGKVVSGFGASDFDHLGKHETGAAGMFRVQQTHLVDAPAVIMLIVDEQGLRLLDRESGKLYQHISWFQLLLWRADHAAIVLILNQTDQQIELMTTSGTSIANSMTANALALREAMSSDTVERSSGGEYPRAPLEFRRELMKFEMQQTLSGLTDAVVKRSRCSRWLEYVFGASEAETGRVHVREQLHAIFTAVDTDGSGTIDLGELSVLLRSVNIVNESTNRELSTNELQLLMIEMDAYDNEVTFDGFATWVMGDEERRQGGSTEGRSLAGRFKRALEHRQKEADAVAQIFDKIDADHDGLLDRNDFQLFCESCGQESTEEGFYFAWASLDRDRTGQIAFKDFFAWFKSGTVDAIASHLIQSIRTTRLLTAAKGAMVLAVDKRNSKAKRSLKAMFDSMDMYGTGDVGLIEMLSMVDDLGVDLSDKDVHTALTQMNSTGRLGGNITFEDLEMWWCEAPNDTTSGVFRSKLKYIAFRAKAVGVVLRADAVHGGSDGAEKYINDSLAAAYKNVDPLHGRSLGHFGAHNRFRKWCQSVIYEHQATEIALVMIVVVNLALLALPRARQESVLPYYNFGVMIVFTTEAAMRIIVKGFVFEKGAYLSSWSWDAYDFTILMIIWITFLLPADVTNKLHLTANMYLVAPAGGGADYVDWLSMFRSLRVLRFFAQIRNIIAAVAEGRVMMASILVLFFYLSVMFFVLGYQMYNGVTSSQCLDNEVLPVQYRTNPSSFNSTCLWGGEATQGPDGQFREYEMCDAALLGMADTGYECPPTIECNRCVRKHENEASIERLQHVGKYGFDNYGASLLTLMALITCDDWEKFTREYDKDEVLSRALSWPFFFVFVVVSALFFVNLFVSGLAYSFIQIRADSRAMRERDRLKKLMVDTALQEGKMESTERYQKHVLQRLFPKLTRRAKDLLIDPRFALRFRYVIVVNLLFMMVDSWALARAKQNGFEGELGAFYQDIVLSVGEVFFTLAYSYEIMVKLQAIGFKMYFGAENTGTLMSNVVDAVIVVTAWPETVMVVSNALGLSLAGSMDAGSLSSFKILRAFRVMKLVFILPAVESLMLKAFKGLDTILSLVMLLVFVLTIAAIVGKNLFQDCQTERAIATARWALDAHTPNFSSFEQALMVAFQVMTADDWSPLMFKYMDCETWGSRRVTVSALYFISLVTLCYFVLSNLFIAIFIENFKLNDEVKRDMQVESLIQGLTMKKSGADDQSGNQWVSGLREGIEGIENMLQETSHINVLRRRTTNEFMRGARMTGRLTKGTVSKAHRLTRGDAEQRNQSNLNQSLAKCCACFAKYRPRDRTEGMNKATLQAWKIKTLAKSGTLSPANGAWKRRPFHRTLQANDKFHACVYAFIFFDSLQTVLREPDMETGETNYRTFLDLLLLLFFSFEFASMTVAFGFLGGPDYATWPYKSTIFELILLLTQLSTFLMPPWLPLHFFAASVQPFRVVRYMYMITGFRVQIEGLGSAIVAVWTALFLLAISFIFFGIIGMELFKGKLHTCAYKSVDQETCIGDCNANFHEHHWKQMPLCDTADQSCIASFCEQQWQAAYFNFDNITQALKSLASVWSLAGWTQLFYVALDVTEPGKAPVADNSLWTAFVYFFTFILINSFLMTKLVTSMLCDFFAQKSGSDKTTDQRNWNFMSIFLVDALKFEVIKPPDKNRLAGLGLECYKIIHRQEFKQFIDVVVVLSVLATFALQQMDCFGENSMSFACGTVYTLDTLVLLAFWFEFAITIASVGREQYLKNYQLVALVLVMMSLDAVWRLFAPVDKTQGVETRKLGMWLHTANCLRALRVVTVLKRVNPIKKIVFLVAVAADKVLTLFLLMASVFVIFAFYASTLCHGVYEEKNDAGKIIYNYDQSEDGSINVVDNFATSKSSVRVLWQICTGQSMMGANRECAEWYAHSPDEGFPELRASLVYAFFVFFFFCANMLFLNLFIALLLDFDLMGSEEMAVSDTDLLLFKKFWCDNETGKADVASGRLAERRTIHSAIHLHDLKEFVLGAADFNVGTFSMMPRADRFYFNRVLYELKKSPADVVDSQRGTAVHTIPFFELLYAVCHIRFSSSCLSLAEEVEKSLEMVEYIEHQAAQVIQVGVRAFCARRSVSRGGVHAPPGCVWPVLGSRDDRIEDMEAMAHPEPDVSRCKVCTLPNEKGIYMWCSCAEKRHALMNLMGENLMDEQQHSPRARSLYKERWDIGVNCALLFELHSLIQTGRLTPEHLVAQEFNRLAAQDRKRQGGFVGMITANTTHHNRLTLCLTRGMRKREEKIEMLQLRGLHLMKEGTWDEAAKQFKEALELDTDDFEQVAAWKEECERKHKTAESIRQRMELQSANRKALLKTKEDRMGASMDTQTTDSDLDQAPLIAAVRAVFSLPRTTVVTNFSHMCTKANRKLVEPMDFMAGLVELAKISRSTLTKKQVEVLMRTIDKMPCSDNTGGQVDYRTFADMVCNVQSLNEFCDAVVDEGVAMKSATRKRRKIKGDGDMTRSMFGSNSMKASLDLIISQDSMHGGNSLDDQQNSEEEEEVVVESDTSLFYCPLTKELMVDPVIACDGNSYERYAYADFWSDHGQILQKLEKRKSPVTGKIMESAEAAPNHVLRKEIAAWRKAEELREQRQKDKTTSIEYRTRRLKKASHDMTLEASDSQAAVGVESLNSPMAHGPVAFGSGQKTDGKDRLSGKKRFGLGWTANEQGFAEHKEEFKKFSNPLAADTPIEMPSSDDAERESWSFESEPMSLAAMKKASSKDGKQSADGKQSKDGRHVEANPIMSISADSATSADLNFEVEEDTRKATRKRSRSRKLGKQPGGRLGKLKAALKKKEPEVIAQYKALHNAPCHESASLSSETLLAGIYTGEIISVIDRVRSDATIRVMVADRGWASVTTPDGELQLELVDESEYWYIPQNSVYLREECDRESPKVSFLLKHVKAVATEHMELEAELEDRDGLTGEVRVDVWVKCDDGKGVVGWAAVKDEDGNVQMQHEDTFDELRFHLRKLSLEALTRQALDIDADQKVVAKATDASRCIDPRNTLVEIIKQLYETTVPVLDLRELPPGWDGSETGRLAEGERVRVNAFAGLQGEMGHVSADVQALHDKRGYVVYELDGGMHGSYEVKIDKIRRTVVLPRENLVRQHDEKANKGLVTAVLSNDVQSLRKLLERVDKPADAFDRSGALVARMEDSHVEDNSDRWKGEPGVLRVVQTVNMNDRDFDREYHSKGLFEIACLRAAEHHEPLAVKQLLMEKLLLKAVIQDDLPTVQMLVEEDDQLYMLPLLRSSCSTMGPWATNPPTAVIELARQIWKAGGYGHHGGMANTMEAAEHLGGRCWLHLSKKFQEEFAEEFDPQIHTVEKIHQMHSALNKKAMKRRFGGKQGVDTTEEQTQRMLEWKSRQFA